MALKISNSLGKKIQTFEPSKKGEVSMYVCGITPDAATHLGHAFTYLSFDILVRFLKYKGYKVNYLQNVTDIDDDILIRSKAAGNEWKEFGEKWTEVFQQNMKALNWTAPSPYVKATDSIPTIIKIVKELIEKGFCYEVKGNVYFEVAKFQKYGELSGFTKEQMVEFSKIRGADPEDLNKRNPLDFIVWQKSKVGEPSWKSPWGEGRPGWHIECSAMIFENLGSPIDIHGGGEDLIYPHHESEIAQSESFASKEPFVKYWMHTGSVLYEGEKMSKSLGNLILISDLLKHYSANAVRFLLLSHHYRQPWEYEEMEMKEAAGKMEELEKVENGELRVENKLDPEFIETLEDDLNTPKALEILLNKKPANLKSHLKLLGFKI